MILKKYIDSNLKKKNMKTHKALIINRQKQQEFYIGFYKHLTLQWHWVFFNEKETSIKLNNYEL